MAGSSVTETANNLGVIKTIEFACVGDDADGTIPDTVLTQKIDGYLLMLETNPGSTGPTANYDIAIDDEEGIDVLQTVGANRHTSNSEVAAIPFGTYFHPPVSPDQALTLKFTNTSVNNATVKVILYWSASGG